MKSDTLFKLKNIHKNYRLGKTEIRALTQIHLEITAQDFLVIAGPSGSGKTTLLNIIGLIDSPSSGELWLGDTRLDLHPQNRLFRYRRDYLGYIYQTFNLIPVLTVFENVEYPLILKKIPRRDRKRMVIEV